MSKIYIRILMLFFLPSAFAQTPLSKISPTLNSKILNSSSGEYILIWIYFSDKGSNTDF